MTAATVQAKAPLVTKLLRALRSIVLILCLGLVIGWTLNKAAAALERREAPAGLIHGIVQGALMPMSMPNLAIGKDVTIYAAKNTGRTYKLGYTMGVNGCGLIFFGCFFYRLRKLKLRPADSLKS
jgi:hypothetical protein